MHNKKYKTIFFSMLGICLVLGGLSHYINAGENKRSGYSEDYENGKNLAFNICGQCHYDEASKRFMGKEMKDLPDFIGAVYSSNLTHSKSFGVLEKYSDGEFMKLIKTGVARDGRYVPYMIRPNLADSDLVDIVLYFRSNDTALQAVDKVAGKTDLNVIGKVGAKVTGKPLAYLKINPPKDNDTLGYGRYLVDNLACFHCHSKNIIGLDYLKPENSKGYMAGGYKFKTRDGKKITGSNLTPDDKTGIGNFTKYDLRKALMNGVRPDGEKLRFPMQQFKHLTKKQSDAIYYYLQTLQPVKNKVKR